MFTLRKKIFQKRINILSIHLDSTALSQHSSVNQANRIWAMVITTSIISGALFGSLLTTAIHFHNDWHEHNELYDDREFIWFKRILRN